MDPTFLVGAVANIAGIVTFVDWAVIKSRARKQKQPLDRSLNALEKLEGSLKGISTAVKQKKGPSEIKRCLDLLCEAQADLVKELREIGIEIPTEESFPKVRGASDEALLEMVNICEAGVLQAKNELTKV